MTCDDGKNDAFTLYSRVELGNFGNFLTFNFQKTLTLFEPYLNSNCSVFRLRLFSNQHRDTMTSVPYKRKKVRNFFRHFRTENLRIPAFSLPPKTLDSRGSQRLALVCRRNRGEKLQNLDEGPFFFFLEITFKLDKNDEKIFGIFTLSLERSHYFRHFRRR